MQFFFACNANKLSMSWNASSNTAAEESCLIGKDMKLPVWTKPTAAGALLGSNCLWNFGLLCITTHIKIFFLLVSFLKKKKKVWKEMSLNVPHLCELWEGAGGQTDVALACSMSFGILCPRGLAEPRESPSGLALLQPPGSRLSPSSLAPGSRGTPSSCVM